MTNPAESPQGAPVRPPLEEIARRCSPGTAQPVGRMDAALADVMEWHDATFTREVATPLAKAHHLIREAKELEQAPHDPEELADIVILAATSAHVQGYDLAEAVAGKLAKLRLRTWGEPDADGVVEHVRDVPPCPGERTPEEPECEPA